MRKRHKGDKEAVGHAGGPPVHHGTGVGPGRVDGACSGR